MSSTRCLIGRSGRLILGLSILALSGCGLSSGTAPESPSLVPPSSVAPSPPVLPGEDMPELAAEGRTIRVPILMYHHIAEWRPKTTVAQRRYIVRPAVFREQLRWLKENGYRSITADQLSRALHGEDVTLPPKPVVITLDDGFNDSVSIGAPILNEEGFNAVFFVVVASVQERAEAENDRGHASWDQLRELLRQGHEVESHSMKHPLLAKIPHDEVVRELTDSRRILLERLGVTSRFFSVPYGSTNDEVREAMRQAGYELGFAITAGVDHPVGSKFMDVKRIEMQEDMDRFKRYVRWEFSPKETPPSAAMPDPSATPSL